MYKNTENACDSLFEDVIQDKSKNCATHTCFSLLESSPGVNKISDVKVSVLGSILVKMKKSCVSQTNLAGTVSPYRSTQTVKYLLN